MIARLAPCILFLCASASAQFTLIELKFEGVGCAPCIESMPERMKRMRGVESASVDLAKGILSVKLARQNRVRVEQIRDAIEQDGTKARSAAVAIRGAAAKSGDGWTLSAPGLSAHYKLEGADLRAGECAIAGEISAMRPSEPPLAIRVREQKMLP